MKKIILIAVLAAASAYFLIGGKDEAENNKLFEPQIREAGGVSFEAVPADFSFKNPVKFEIKMDTHSGSLDFDLTEISFLEDDVGNRYMPLEWQGPATGGHHLSGILVFSKINSSANKIKLIINSAVPKIFEWQIK